jgi:hypothetical protein
VLPHTDEKCRHPFATSRTAAKLAAPLPSATPRTRMPGYRRAQHNAAAGEPHLRRKRHRNIWCWLEKHLWARTAPGLFTHPGKPLKLLTSSPPSERTTSKISLVFVGFLAPWPHLVTGADFPSGHGLAGLDRGESGT